MAYATRSELNLLSQGVRRQLLLLFFSMLQIALHQSMLIWFSQVQLMNSVTLSNLLF
ncbi:hypothetical protein P608_19030 [Comamonas thiooxydans]|uniref:Uncharacterized protein n=1 Tax=Comamonas thiooxydans TaxID=363952 RepID=A0A0E3BQG1_9BURK|nr:hypothetical protein P608_19030 [Comamonas thiooxydans]KGH16785.1 hypothetical protein P607_18830 [Comamonas thiooxydans]